MLSRTALVIRSFGCNFPKCKRISDCSFSSYKHKFLLQYCSNSLSQKHHVRTLMYSQTLWSSNIKNDGLSQPNKLASALDKLTEKTVNNDKQRSSKNDTVQLQKTEQLLSSATVSSEEEKNNFDDLKQKPTINKVLTASNQNVTSKTKDNSAKGVASTSDNKYAEKKKKRVEQSIASFERTFITPVKAMNEFLLKPSDLEGLPKTRRRTPYESETMLAVYWRKDVNQRALEIWGSKESLRNEKTRRELERKKYQQSMFSVKRRLRDYRKYTFNASEVKVEKSVIQDRSGGVIMTAIGINALNCFFKLIAWAYTGSSSMFSECIHSVADTANQCILAYGIKKSVQIADADHPYGYTNMRYVASLISGVGIFCVGAGLSFYHGVTGLFHPHPVEDFFWAYYVLFGSLLSEGGTCLVALNSVRKSAEKMKMPLKDYIIRGQEPSVNVVLLEDFAAVLGVVVAGTCMAVTTMTNNPRFDAMGSLLIGGILATVASFIIYTNAAALVGRSIPLASLEKINSQLENDVMIRAIHDVKGIDMGNFLVRYKAELDFDGRQLTKIYLDKIDLNLLLDEVQQLHNIDLLQEFMLRHGENIVDMMGAEIDRIEMKLRASHPEIRHCDLEIL